MALETVVITVQDDALIPAPVDDVVVRVFDATGTALITSAVTGAVTPGVAEFTLNGDDPAVDYQLRFFIADGSIVSPQLIGVFSPPGLAPTGANNFLITAYMFAENTATDPRLCRCSGYVRGPDGLPKRGLDMHFIPRFKPLVVDASAVLGERVAVITDRAGFASVDLYRGACYDVTIESLEDIQRLVVIPDRAALNLAHLLFPIVVAVEYDPPGPWTVATGAVLEIEPNVLASDFQELGVADSDVEYSTDDSSIASVRVLSDRIQLVALSAGTTSLRVKRRDITVVYAPDPGIEGSSVNVTVF